MSGEDELEWLLEAERKVRAPAVLASAGWLRLAHALEQGAPAMDVPTSALDLGAPGASAWTVAGPAALLVVAGTAALASRGASEAPPAAPSAMRSADLRRAEVPIVAIEPPPPVHTPAPSPSAFSAPGPAGNNGDTAFEEEVRLIELAKRELDAGRALQARRWLDEHAGRFSKGVFALERDALRILIGCADGEPEAATQARDFTKEHPESPLAARIARACRARGAQRGATVLSSPLPSPPRSPASGSTASFPIEAPPRSGK
jgi:hypothetical protein